MPDPDSLSALRAHGVTKLFLRCLDHACGRMIEIELPPIGPHDAKPFTALTFRCTACNGREAQAVPMWSATGGYGP